MGTRITGGGAERVYEAAEKWVDCALKSDDSLFTPGQPIWSSRWLGELHTRFLNQPYETGGRFLEKLQRQLKDSPPEVYQLIGEALYFYFLVVSTKNSTREEEVIDTILSWSSDPIVTPPNLVAGLTPGLVNPGQHFHQGRPFQVGFIVEFVEQWKEQEQGERSRLLEDSWAFKDFAMGLNCRSALLRDFPDSSQLQREALLHLVFPDVFESIVSADHKALITEAFADLVTEPTRDVDHALQQIRQKLEPQYGNLSHFFYQPAIHELWNPKDDAEPPIPPESLQALADSLFLPAEFLSRIERLLEDKKQVIFQGPPGTGKTYVAQALAQYMAGSKERVTLVQFHPSYAYEDFVQGYRPALLDNGQAGFNLRNGPLLDAAERAREEPEEKHFLIIDEINRGNLAKVFGELYFLLEYRKEEMRLQYSEPGDGFSLPDNLYVIGTMNTADRSIALVDLALRRRFYFVEFHPGKWPVEGLLQHWLDKNTPNMGWVAVVVDEANKKLNDTQAAIGPSYFMKKGLDEEMARLVWEHNVLPYIEERLFGDRGDRLAEFALDKLRPRAGGPSPEAGDVDGPGDGEGGGVGENGGGL